MNVVIANKTVYITEYNIQTKVKAYLIDEYVPCNLLNINTDIFIEEMI